VARKRDRNSYRVRNRDRDRSRNRNRNRDRNSVVQNRYLVWAGGLQLAHPVSGGCIYGG